MHNLSWQTTAFDVSVQSTSHQKEDQSALIRAPIPTKEHRIFQEKITCPSSEESRSFKISLSSAFKEAGKKCRKRKKLSSSIDKSPFSPKKKKQAKTVTWSPDLQVRIILRENTEEGSRENEEREVLDAILKKKSDVALYLQDKGAIDLSKNQGEWESTSILSLKPEHVLEYVKMDDIFSLSDEALEVYHRRLIGKKDHIFINRDDSFKKKIDLAIAEYANEILRRKSVK